MSRAASPRRKWGTIDSRGGGAVRLAAMFEPHNGMLYMRFARRYLQYSKAEFIR
jgi:hypothetical protein